MSLSMKYTLLVLLASAALIMASTGCATDGEYRHGSPPPGSHSPFAGADESDPTQAHRDEPEPDPDRADEEEPEEPEPERQ